MIIITDKENTFTLRYNCFPAKVIDTENWLKAQAKSGWRLTKKSGDYFTFRKCTPYEAEFFMYSGFNAHEAISFDYHMARKLYHKSSSEINKTSLEIFEADTTKLDEKYWDYKDLRNAYYKRHYKSMSIFFGLITSLAAIACFTFLAALLPLLLSLGLFVYHLRSFFILNKYIQAEYAA